MKSARLLIEQLQRHEGLRLRVYRCPAGKLTIGYGRNLEDKGISKQEAGLMLANDLVEVRKAIEEDEEHGKIFEKMNDARKGALINMGFNLGVKGLFGFRNMWRALKKNNFDLAAKEMLDSQWARQVGSRSLELAAQMRTGQWPDEWQIV
jgi:lysozyme